ncbi:MAG: FmdB family zinc ribbon protein [Phycisphaerales bacterium]
MPLYEYVCEKDGARLELLRPASQADAPVEDPEGKGRTFTRVFSTFAAQGAGGPGPGASARPSPSGLTGGGCCPCGKPRGGCSSL